MGLRTILIPAGRKPVASNVICAVTRVEAVSVVVGISIEISSQANAAARCSAELVSAATSDRPGSCAKMSGDYQWLKQRFIHHTGDGSFVAFSFHCGLRPLAAQ